MRIIIHATNAEEKAAIVDVITDAIAACGISCHLCDLEFGDNDQAARIARDKVLARIRATKIPVQIETQTTFEVPPRAEAPIASPALVERCAACGGRLGWEDGENGEWVSCLTCAEGRAKRDADTLAIRESQEAIERNRTRAAQAEAPVEAPLRVIPVDRHAIRPNTPPSDGVWWAVILCVNFVEPDPDIHNELFRSEEAAVAYARTVDPALNPKVKALRAPVDPRRCESCGDGPACIVCGRGMDDPLLHVPSPEAVAAMQREAGVDPDSSIYLTDEAKAALIARRVVPARVLLEACKTLVAVAAIAHEYWDNDKDAKVGKLLLAMSGALKGYRADLDAAHAVIAEAEVRP